ncbi:MAG: GNAT family N-acetyltransferase [Pseudomonadota bacterium]|nr:GNAT family N-acetyltransferase [Pseudomonadota bacterium]MEE3098193.1 GNAT family N-acetyltransferase [Pseudomonadota bacterium]
MTCVRPFSCASASAAPAPRPARAVAFARLTAIDPDAIAAHMSDPRMAEHMPLLTGVAWDRAAAEAFVAAKEARWAVDGMGHQAILADGAYAGWGGFEKTGEDWDFGLVLTPAAFGLGPAATRAALAMARADPRIGSVTFLLPPTRARLGALARLGARRDGEAEIDGARFLRFRLATA